MNSKESLLNQDIAIEKNTYCINKLQNIQKSDIPAVQTAKPTPLYNNQSQQQTNEQNNSPSDEQRSGTSSEENQLTLASDQNTAQLLHINDFEWTQCHPLNEHQEQNKDFIFQKMIKHIIYKDSENIELRYSKSLVQKYNIPLYQVLYRQQESNRYLLVEVYYCSLLNINDIGTNMYNYFMKDNGNICDIVVLAYDDVDSQKFHNMIPIAANEQNAAQLHIINMRLLDKHASPAYSDLQLSDEEYQVLKEIYSEQNRYIYDPKERTDYYLQGSFADLFVLSQPYAQKNIDMHNIPKIQYRFEHGFDNDQILPYVEVIEMIFSTHIFRQLDEESELNYDQVATLIEKRSNRLNIQPMKLDDTQMNLLVQEIEYIANYWKTKYQHLNSQLIDNCADNVKKWYLQHYQAQ